LRRARAASPRWLVLEGIRAVTVLSCPECGFVGFEGLHPRQKLSARARSHLGHLEAQALARLAEAP
jgi:hypothetical protein